MTDRDVRTGASGMRLNCTALAPEFPRSNVERRSARTLLPLPPGEGWGEGTATDVNPWRGLVAQPVRRFSVWPKEGITLTPGPSPGGRGENEVLVLE
jgi:hypothetical protein